MHKNVVVENKRDNGLGVFNKQNKEYDFENNINELRKEYTVRPEVTNRAVVDALHNIRANDKYDEDYIFGIPLKVFYRIVMIGLMIFLGFVNVNMVDPTSEFPWFLYFFGMIFFLAGFYVGLNAGPFGIIFLFSHGMTGLGIMIASSGVFNEIFLILLQDASRGMIMYFGVAAALVVFATLYIIVTSVRKSRSQYREFLPLGCYLIAIVMLKVFPYIMNSL